MRATLSVYERARGRMLIMHPFFATLILSTPVIADDSVETAATDMVRIWYSPSFIESLDVATAMFVMAHETFHIILKHGFRTGARDPELANIAQDHEINLHLKKAGFKLWDKCCCDARFEGMPWEKIYEILKKEEKQEPGKHKGRGGESQGQDGQGRPRPMKGMGKPREGKHADGIGRDCQAPEQMTPGEKVMQEQKIDSLVAQAYEQASMAGKMPASLGLLVTGLIHPPLPWYDVLRDLMTRMAKSEESWSRPNRRVSCMPSYRNPGMGVLGIIGDTSGSMLRFEIFRQIGAEITECNEVCKPEKTILVWADHAEASHVQEFEPGDEIVMEPKGGGGTDMRLPLRYIEQFEPAAVVMVTDAETPWPSEPTPFPLIVLTTKDTGGRGHIYGSVPDWAYEIRIR